MRVSRLTTVLAAIGITSALGACSTSGAADVEDLLAEVPATTLSLAVVDLPAAAEIHGVELQELTGLEQLFTSAREDGPDGPSGRLLSEIRTAINGQIGADLNLLWEPIDLSQVDRVVAAHTTDYDLVTILATRQDESDLRAAYEDAGFVTEGSDSSVWTADSGEGPEMAVRLDDGLVFLSMTPEALRELSADDGSSGAPAGFTELLENSEGFATFAAHVFPDTDLAECGAGIAAVRVGDEVYALAYTGGEELPARQVIRFATPGSGAPESVGDHLVRYPIEFEDSPVSVTEMLFTRFAGTFC